VATERSSQIRNFAKPSTSSSGWQSVDRAGGGRATQALLHLGGTPWARIGEHVGQRNLAVTANTYTHVLVDETEIDYAPLLT
jgi:hypothetical protein